MKHFFVALLSLVSLNAFSAANLCVKTPILNRVDFKNLSGFIVEHPVKQSVFNEAQIKVGQNISTQKNEFATIIFNQPYKIEFQIFPESAIEILSNSTPCPQIRVYKGKVLSTGNHPTNNTCEFEVETEEAYIQPTGTSYLIETSSLSDAIAELNGEPVGGGLSNLVSVGKTGTIELGSHEKYSVKKGTIQIRLKRISKIKKQNKIKYVKASVNKKSKSKKSVAKNSKQKRKIRFLAFNEKIKLKAGSSLNVKRKKSSKRMQTAELTVTDSDSN